MFWIYLLFFIFNTAHKAAISALLLVAWPREYFIQSFISVDKWRISPAPPRGGSLWLAPSKQSQGISLFMTGSIIVLLLTGTKMSLCSWILFKIQSDGKVRRYSYIFLNGSVSFIPNVIHEKNWKSFITTYRFILPPCLHVLFQPCIRSFTRSIVLKILCHTCLYSSCIWTQSEQV